MKGRRNTYSQAELDWISDHRAMTRADLHAAFCKTFNRSDVTLGALKGLCKRKRWLTGRDGRIKPGAVSHNKGKTMPSHPNSVKTRFKKGNLPHNTKHLGHERLNTEGYVEISIDERNPHTGYERRYVLKHRWLWEQANGPVPDGMVLKSIDGNKQNTDPGNWIVIPRALLPRLAGRWSIPYDEAEDELKPYLLAVAQLQHAARVAKREAAT